MKKKTQRNVRFDNLTDEVIAKRWLDLRAKSIRWVLCFGGSALLIFVANHFFPLPQKAVDVLNVVFQICSAFTACSAFLAVAAKFFSRPAKSPAS